MQDAFIQSDFNCIQAIHFIILCIPYELLWFPSQFFFVWLKQADFHSNTLSLWMYGLLDLKVKL